MVGFERQAADAPLLCHLGDRRIGLGSHDADVGGDTGSVELLGAAVPVPAVTLTCAVQATAAAEKSE